MMKTPKFAIKVEPDKKPEPERGDAIQIHTRATGYGMKILLPESLDNDRLIDLLSRIPAKAFTLPDDKTIAFDFQSRLCTQELLVKLLCNVIWRKRIKVEAWLSSNPETLKLFRSSGLEIKEPEVKKPEKIIENTIDNKDNKAEIKVENKIIYEPRNLKVLYNSMRSGDSLVTAGDVLLWGHLNAGAEIKAGGNIIVAGKLRGLVHAGQGLKNNNVNNVNNNERVFVMAGSFEARQLRIGRKLCYADENTAGWHKSVLITLEDGMPMIRENKFEIF